MSSVDAVPPRHPTPGPVGPVDAVAPAGPVDAVEQLIDDWQSASLSAGWPADEPWWLPEVDPVARSLAASTSRSGGLAAACSDLGTGRAEAGFDLEDARSDLMIGLRLVGSDAVNSMRALDALTLGWIEATLTAAREAGSVDPLTRLASQDYLLVRLGELYAAAAKAGGTPAQSHQLLVVRLPTASEPLVREMRMILLERALRSVLDAGQTIARLAPNVVVAVVETAGETSDATNGRLRAALDEWLSPEQLEGAAVEWHPLPDGAGDLPLILWHVRQRH